ncbi:HECT ubiquitin protein ligase family protein KAK [Wolffia australiana]
METRGRKRAEASLSAASQPPLTRASKRQRTAAFVSSIITRSRQSALSQESSASSGAVRAMDSTESSAGRREIEGRRRGSGKGRQADRERDSADKGKEKEQDVSRARERDRVAERILGLNIDAGGRGDGDGDGGGDDDSDGGAGILHQNFTSASSALQGLLRKLGAGLDDLLPSSAISGASSSHQSGRLKKILSGLRAEGEEGRQVEALTQLCDMLSIGTEDSLGSFSVDTFVPVLVGLLNHESNPDIMLLAARAITHLCDVLPSSCAAVVHYGAVPCLCSRLLTIEYMDLAEQSLQALKKISQEHPTACLRAGALMAVLSYLDFFSTGVQRVALSTAANMCKKIPYDAADYVMEAVPLLTNLLYHHDSKVLEHASVCLTRIAEGFASCPEKLDELCNHGLVTQAAAVISPSHSGGGQASLSSATYTGLIRLLSTCASGSPLGAKTLLLHSISGTLKDILAGYGLASNITRPPEQIFEIMNLADALLPPLPHGMITVPSSINVFTKGSTMRRSSASSSSKLNSSSSTPVEISAREKLLQDQPELLQQFGVDLLPLLIKVYGSSVNGPVRHKCLSVIGKLMYFSDAEMIQSLISVTNVSSFLSGVLAWKDPHVLIPALQIAEILMDKLPETFSKLFVREGVVHAISSLILPDSSGSVPVQSATSEDGSNGASSHARRRAPCLDGNPVEDSGNGQAEITGVNPTLRSAVSAKAKSFRDKYFSANPSSGLTSELLLLKDLCGRLNAAIEEVRSNDKEEEMNAIITELLNELQKSDGVSTFEFIGSGVVEALLNYLCGCFTREKKSGTDLSRLQQLAKERFKSFIAIALPQNLAVGSELLMTPLVQKLQSALSSLERFPVVLSHSRSSSGGPRLSYGLSALSQPFKLRLCRAPGEKSVRDYSSNVVLIDPLASLAAIEEFLWPRIQRSDAGHKYSSGGSDAPGLSTPPASTGPCYSTRSRSLAGSGSTKKSAQEVNASSSKAKGKAVMRSASEGTKGPRTRGSLREKPSAEKVAHRKPLESDYSSEDELGISPVEIDDSLVLDDDDMSEDEFDDDDDDDEEVLRDDTLPNCTPEKVHDVKLGEDGGDGTTTPTSENQEPSSRTTCQSGSTKSVEPAEFRGSGSANTRGAMSFAAAAIAGLVSGGSGRGTRSGRDRRGFTFNSTSNDPPKLVFLSNGKPLNRHLTIYQAVQRQLVLEEDEDERSMNADFASGDGSRLWGDIYTITYQRADGQNDQSSQMAAKSSGNRYNPALDSSSDSKLQHHRSSLESIMEGDLPCDLDKSNSTYNILALLRVLEGLNQLAPRLRILAASDAFVQGEISDFSELSMVTGPKVPVVEFISNKLYPKLARQIQDALALCSGSLPSWCYQLPRACPFLFPFETRRDFFYSTAFGLSRALHRLQQQRGADGHNSGHEREVRIGRLQRQKVRVSRSHILDSAAKVMEMYASQKTVLEVEYFGEVGTGLGPTLEFYTLLSHDLQKKKLGLWRSNSSEARSEDLVDAPLGLFPRPWASSVDCADGSLFSKVVDYFRLIGRVVAKALQDGRLLDLPLSTAFYKLVLGQELDLLNISSFDPELGKTLLEMQLLVRRKQHLESSAQLSEEEMATQIKFRGASVVDLCLGFTLPGYPDYVLKEGEENTTVDINNLEEYISLVVDATVKTGISRQIEAFRAGFNQVFDISSLQIFSPEELDYLLCGHRELWEADTLHDHIKFDHGYTAKSPPILNLLEIMGEFTQEQQRAFCQFVTGAPRLPPGGLAVLNPKLTIVRKHPSSGAAGSAGANASESADDDLPSVMTCANYLKLPPYSSKEIMLVKLLYAINEGQGSFDLS